MRGPKQVEPVLFLLAEVLRANFADRAERRWRMTATFKLLAGRNRVTKREMARIDEELAKCDD